jgi:transcriptional regulator with XRE-family HTH domain
MVTAITVRMRRLMLGMSQEKLGDALGLTFQQVQKYEKGTNRIGASRLQHITHILQVPVAFFFEAAPSVPGAPQADGTAPSPAYVTDFLTTVGRARAHKGIHADQELEAQIVDLVQEIVDGEN